MQKDNASDAGSKASWPKELNRVQRRISHNCLYSTMYRPNIMTWKIIDEYLCRRADVTVKPTCDLEPLLIARALITSSQIPNTISNDPATIIKALAAMASSNY